jgi:spore germination cell wall hydrolase CwlJ-like protein
MKKVLLIIFLLFSIVTPSICNKDNAYASYYRESMIKKAVIARDLKQLECLSDNIYHESKGEPYNGRVAVGFVTINRANDQSFPDNICEVVKQKEKKTCQFSWYCQPSKKKHSKKPITKKLRDIDYIKSMLVAEMVMTRKIQDPSKGSLYFHANYVKVKRKGKVVKAKIGDHIFYNVKKKL